MAWNTQKIQKLMDLPDHRRADNRLEDLAAVAAGCYTAHQFPWCDAFPA
jgi:hypothetical protein